MFRHQKRIGCGHLDPADELVHGDYPDVLLLAHPIQELPYAIHGKRRVERQRSEIDVKRGPMTVENVLQVYVEQITNVIAALAVRQALVQKGALQINRFRIEELIDGHLPETLECFVRTAALT